MRKPRRPSPMAGGRPSSGHTARLGVALAAAAVGLYELGMHVPEYVDRQAAFRDSLAYCRAVGKPLLRIGVHRSPLEPPNGDVTLDLDRSVVDPAAGIVLGDERAMVGFGDGQFGVCFNEHTLEHLPSPEDAALAVGECLRVADYAVLLFPSPNHSVFGRWITSPSGLAALQKDGPYTAHHLQLYVAQGGIRVARLEHVTAAPVSIFVPIPNSEARGYGSIVIGSRYTSWPLPSAAGLPAGR